MAAMMEESKRAIVRRRYKAAHCCSEYDRQFSVFSSLGLLSFERAVCKKNVGCPNYAPSFLSRDA